MSNRINVEVEKVADELYDVQVSDDYDSGNITLYHSPTDDDIGLLKEVRKLANEKSSHSPQAKRVNAILDYMKEEGKGATIRDTYYDFNELAPAFDVEEG